MFTKTIKIKDILDPETVARLTLILAKLPPTYKHRMTLNGKKWLLRKTPESVFIERDDWYRFKSCFPVLIFNHTNTGIEPFCELRPDRLCAGMMLLGLIGFIGALLSPLLLIAQFQTDFLESFIGPMAPLLILAGSYYLMYYSERKRLLNDIDNFISSLYLIKDGQPWPPGDKQNRVSSQTGDRAPASAGVTKPPWDM